MRFLRPAALAVLAVTSSLAVHSTVSRAAEAPAESADTAATGILTEVQVTARHLDEARNALMPETGSSTYRFDTEDLKNLPLGDATPLNEVLLRAPGVTQDSFGQLHVRGDHANLQYRINDIVIPESISLFGQALNPRFASEINLLTGALPAQYGYRTAGVVDIHTKGSSYQQGGDLNLLAGSHNDREANAEWSGGRGPLSMYVTGGYTGNDLGIENPLPTKNALHDHTGQTSAFSYLSYLLSDDSRLSLMLGYSNNDFEIPDAPGRAPQFAPPGIAIPDSAALNERQHEGNRFAILAYEGSVHEVFHYQVALYDRLSDVHYAPDPLGDLNYTGAAGEVYRRNNRWGVQADASWRASEAHTVRLGLTYNDETALSRTTTTVYPLDAGGNPVFAPVAIADNGSDLARLYGLYLQDEWHPLDKLTVNYGARYDWYQGALDEHQLSPRLGLVYELDATTTLHAGYARYFTPPPTEKIRLETIGLFENTTAAPVSAGNDPVLSERSHYFDVGVLKRLTPALSLGLDGYYRAVENLIDEGQFGPALVFAPFNYAAGRVWGIEFTGSWRHDGTGAYLNAAYGTATGRRIVSGQYNFAPDKLAAIASQYIHLDHDQRWTGSAGLSQKIAETTLSLDALVGSGLRSGFINSDHLPSYVQVNLGAHRRFDLGGLGALDGSLAVLNLLDRVYEIRDGSGVGVGAPQWGIRRSLYVGISRPFGR